MKEKKVRAGFLTGLAEENWNVVSFYKRVQNTAWCQTFITMYDFLQLNYTTKGQGFNLRQPFPTVQANVKPGFNENLKKTNKQLRLNTDYMFSLFNNKHFSSWKPMYCTLKRSQETFNVSINITCKFYTLHCTAFTAHYYWEWINTLLPVRIQRHCGV